MEAVETLPPETVVLLLSPHEPPRWVITTSGSSPSDASTIEDACPLVISDIKDWNTRCVVVLFTEAPDESLTPLQRLAGHIRRLPEKNTLDFKAMEGVLRQQFSRVQDDTNFTEVSMNEVAMLLLNSGAVQDLVTPQQFGQFRAVILAAQSSIKLAATPNPKTLKLTSALRDAASNH